MLSRPTETLIQPVFFAEPGLAGPLDARRWRSGERNTRYARSPLHGWGSFATRRIERGAAVLVREPLSGNFPVNHSAAPNTARAMNRSGLFALRDIAAGEEITEDYRLLPFFAQAIPLLPQRLRAGTRSDYESLLRAWGWCTEKESNLQPSD